MDLEVGTVLEGKVTGITKFGAFVSFPSGKSGLVHISEIAYPYVQNVSDHLTDGQTVKVKVIGIDENGRINLSIKKAVEQPGFAPRVPQAPNRNQKLPPRAPAYRSAAAQHPVESPASDTSFEDKLKRFMQDSDSKISSLKQYSERKSGTTRRRSSKG
jgi:Predicted RNA binding protein (contains ribosomal protein S1 domain)